MSVEEQDRCKHEYKFDHLVMLRGGNKSWQIDTCVKCGMALMRRRDE